MLGTHAGFIVAAYGFAVVVIAGLFLWVGLDGRAQRRQLAELEARGIRRRSDVAAGGEGR
ncbi:heme exporter protein CcmD [Siculibacillus lacustris]|uniref:Heme exporter protein D n=1 Tax=Siculibacillus lacustris TaxID=1549641 RepID=A0A4Q9VLI8_9HYPH|nr:heme exporter protein CcmD [Siculibacillus lacustris]TBW36327.1 heme exporter protein CcmD [Siculibacillus lacustris]